MECKIGFNNGDVVSVALKYEDLHRYCFTCRRVSHEEGTCPELNDEQRERNRVARIQVKEKEEIANREAFSLLQPRREISISKATEEPTYAPSRERSEI